MPLRRAALVVLTTVALLAAGLAPASAKAKPFKVTAAPSAAVLAPGGSVTVTGKVTPKATKKAVTLQVSSGGGWTTVASGKTDKKSAFSLTYAPSGTGAFTLRVSKGGGGGHTAGTSAPFVVTVQAPAPPPAPAAPYPTAVSSGSYESCALLSNGLVRCWGNNGSGKLGNGTSPDSHAPVTVSGLTDAVAISVGSQHVCAIRSAGTVVCWGSNYDGQLGNGTRTTSGTPVPVSNLQHVVSIAAGQSGTCAVVQDGGVRCWGGNNRGALGDGEPTQTDLGGGNYVDVVSTVPVAVARISDATSVATGDITYCVTRASGGVACWGDGENGQLGNGTTTVVNTLPVDTSSIANAVAVEGGKRTMCATLNDGSHKCWGANANGQLGLGTTTDTTTPTTVIGLNGALSTSGGTGHRCGVMSDRSVTCWGANQSMALGNPATANNALVKTPQAVPALSGGVTSLGAGETSTCALRTDRSIWCWGRNNSGQLGDGTTTDRATPMPVVGLIP